MVKYLPEEQKKFFSLISVVYRINIHRHTPQIPCIHCKNNVRRGFYRERLYRGACSRNCGLYHRNKSYGAADGEAIRDQ